MCSFGGLRDWAALSTLARNAINVEHEFQGKNRIKMGLRKVTLFDKEGTTLVPVDEDGQAKPAVLGVRWVNPDTFETIRVVGGKRTGPKNEVLMEVPPTLDTSPFAIEDLPPPKVKEELKEIEKPGAKPSAKKS